MPKVDTKAIRAETMRGYHGDTVLALCDRVEQFELALRLEVDGCDCGESFTRPVCARCVRLLAALGVDA